MKRPDFPRLLNDQDLFGLLATPRMGKMRALAARVDELWTMFQQSQSDQAIGGSAKFRPYQTLKPSVYPFYPIPQRICWDGINRGIRRGTLRRQAQWCSPGHGFRKRQRIEGPTAPFKVIGLTWLLVKSWQRSSQTSGLVLAGWHKNTHLKTSSAVGETKLVAGCSSHKKTWGKKKRSRHIPGGFLSHGGTPNSSIFMELSITNQLF